MQEKTLIQSKTIEKVTLTVEMISNTESHLFGKFGISASKGGVYSPFLLLDTEAKDVCNCILKAKSISDLMESNIDEIVKITASTVNLYNWMCVVSDVATILNATLDLNEIDCCTNGDDWFDESNLSKILKWKAQDTDKVYKYESKSELVRFVTQMFVCDWLQSMNGIRLSLGKRTSINTIESAWETIDNQEFDYAIKDGKKIREMIEEAS